MRILVALVDIRCLDGLGAGRVEPGRWLFGIVFDSDLIGGFARILESLGDDQGDDFTLMVDAVGRQRRLCGSCFSTLGDKLEFAKRRTILIRHDVEHARNLFGGGKIDIRNAAAGD